MRSWMSVSCIVGTFTSAGSMGLGSAVGSAVIVGLDAGFGIANGVLKMEGLRAMLDGPLVLFEIAAWSTLVRFLFFNSLSILPF
jgi:ABC-type uncharacterized transport system permease subunit